MTDNVVEFKKKLSAHEIKVWNFTQDIDELVTLAVLDGISPVEVCVTLADRLGEAINSAYKCDEASQVFSNVDNLLEFCIQYSKRRLYNAEEKE